MNSRFRPEVDRADEAAADAAHTVHANEPTRIRYANSANGDHPAASTQGAAVDGATATMTVATGATGGVSSRQHVNAYLVLLQRSHLVDRDHLTEAIADFNRATKLTPHARSNVRLLGDFLIERELITRWHHRELLGGRERFFLGKHKLLGLLGKGGMSEVYLAEQMQMHRRVAIKVLPAALVDHPAKHKRFLREAQAIAALDHPNIVPAYGYDFDAAAEVHYLSMQYVEGQDLACLVEQKGVLPCDVAADYIRQAAEGLAHAHERGLVHRDIKPANLLVDRDGVVKILDLGIARLPCDDGGSLTIEQKETVLGTTDYLAPEQALDSHNLTHQADIYSLGCTLYFLLCGRPPFPVGTLAQKLVKHQMETPVDIGELRPDVAPRLRTICQRMMAKKPADRYASCPEVSAVLYAFLTEPEASSSRIEKISSSLSQPLVAPPRQAPLRIAALAGVALAGCLLIVAGLVAWPVLAAVLGTPAIPAELRDRHDRFIAGSPAAGDSQDEAGPVAAASTAAPITAGNVAAFARCELLAVLDGDTIKIEVEGEETSVHLLNVDCPEPGQPQFAACADALRGILGHGPVSLTFQSPTAVSRDTYGRLLAYVYVGKTNANLELIRRGYSRYVTRFGQSRFHADFLAAEADAEKNNRGLWKEGFAK